jgi:hypothetical protein
MKNIKKFLKNKLKQEYLTIMLIKSFLDEKCCYYNFFHLFPKNGRFYNIWKHLETFFTPKNPNIFYL